VSGVAVEENKKQEVANFRHKRLCYSKFQLCFDFFKIKNFTNFNFKCCTFWHSCFRPKKIR